MFKESFPFFSANTNITYLDSAATSQALYTVIEDQNDYNLNHKSNAHRSGNSMGTWVDQKYHLAKEKIGELLGIPNPHNRIIFTSGSSAALADAVEIIKANYRRATIYIGVDSHHSMLLPLMNMVRKHQWPYPVGNSFFNLKFIEVDSQGKLDLTSIEEDIATDEAPKILAVTAVSNVLGVVNDLEEIKTFAKKNNMLTILDASQIVAKRAISLDGFDFVAFSWHKVYGPTGLGTLIISDKWTNAFPVRPGGGTVTHVTLPTVEYVNNAARFEMGTQNLSAIVTIPRLAQWLIDNLEDLERHDIAITKLANSHVSELQFSCVSNSDSGLISMSAAVGAPEDYAYMLDAYGIMIRTGKMCAEPLINKLSDKSGLIRLSWACYTTPTDIETVFDRLGQIHEKLRRTV